MSVNHDKSRETLVRRSEAEQLGTPQSRILLLADSDTTNGAVSANRTLLEQGADGPPPHFHVGSTEIFFVLEGSLMALAGDRVLTLEKGDYLSVPRAMPHAFAAPPGCNADVLITFAPAATQRFEYFRLVDRVLKGRAAPEEILQTQDRFDNHFVESDVWRASRMAQGNGS